MSFQIFETIGRKKVNVPTKLKNHEQICKELAGIVGEKYVEDDIGVLYVYSRVLDELDQYLPNIVVMPKTAEEVSQIMKIANEHKIPVQCQVKGLSMGDIHSLLTGGLLIDLRRMNGVLEVNESAGYALVEAGITWADLRRELQEKHPNFRLQYPFAPAQTGIVSNMLLGGHLVFSTKYGPPTDQILSAEVVLPTGETIYVGSRGLVKSWDHRQDLPSLLGLFVGWHGTTGIVTKAAIRILHKPKHEIGLIFTANDIDSTCQFVRRAARTHCVDGIVAYDWRYAIHANKKVSEIPRTGPPPPGTPESFGEMHYSSMVNEEELELKGKIIKSVAEELHVELYDPVSFGPEMVRLVDLPTVVGTESHCGDLFAGGGGGSGLSWIGGLGDDRYFEKLWTGTRDVFSKYSKIFPMLVIHEMCWGHIGFFREIVNFDSTDPEQVEQVRKANVEALRLQLDCGYVPYKPSKVATEIIMNEYADEGFRNLMRKVKKMLDPNGIMAPGRWEL